MRLLCSLVSSAPRRPMLAAVAVTLTSIIATPTSHGAVLAQFTDGAGNTLPDQYVGAAGAGWQAGWGTIGGQTNVVSSTTPINGGGNYLTSTVTNTADTSVGRRFDPTATGVPNPATDPVRFSFDLRVDDLTGFDAASDYFGPHANNAGAGTFNVTSQSSWIIRAHGANNGGAVAGNWAFYNGAGNSGSFNSALFVDSGMAVVEGTTYSFVVESDPQTKKYTVAVSDGSTTAGGTYGWRSAGASDGVSFTGRVGTTGDSYTFSIDNYRISAIPEPTAIVLLGFGGLAMVARRRNA